MACFFSRSMVNSYMKIALYITYQIFIRVFLAPLIFAFGYYLVSSSFIGPFLCAFAVNLVAGLGFNAYTSAKNKGLELEVHKKEMEMRDKVLDMERNQSIQVPCAYCNTSNTVPLSISVGAFICDKCKKKNRLFLNFRTAQITDVGNDGGPFGSVEIPTQTITVGSI